MYIVNLLFFPAACSDGFNVIGDTCFWVSEKAATWHQAQDECNKKGAKLFIAPTKDGQYQIAGTHNIC